MLILFLVIFPLAVSALTDDIVVDIAKEKTLPLICTEPKEGEFVLWYKHNEKTGSDEELFSEKYTFPSLISVKIHRVKPEDKGLYKCKTPFTEVVIKSFKVTVVDSSKETKPLVEPPKWVLLPNPLKIVDSSRAAVIPCRASGKNVIVKAYKLKQSGEILYELPNKGVVLHKPSFDDSGKYLCTAENKGGKLSHPFEVLVRVHGGVSEWASWETCDAECGYGIQVRNRDCTNPRPRNGGRRCTEKMVDRQRCRSRACSAPRLTKFGFEITDDELIVHCHAKGIPTPTVEWKFDGRRLGQKFDARNPTMKIAKNSAKSGSYSCTVRNNNSYFTMYITIEL